MALKVYLVDDEELALKRLARMIKATERAEIVGMSTDPVEAGAFLTLSPCDVLFLDIEMPVLSGFQLLEKLDNPPVVIFTTAYSQYALQAFETNSVDYLLKPIEPAQLDRALNKVERLCGAREAQPDLKAFLAQLKSAVQASASGYPLRVASKVGDKLELIELNRVTHFYAEDKLTFAATAAKSHVMDSTISDLENSLDPSKFVRIHRATLVNIDFVQEVHSWFSGRVLVRLKDGKQTELTVARDRVRELKQRLGV